METTVTDQLFVIDFDSTFTQVEALDELADILLSGKPERDSIVKDIQDITNQAMEGKISFRQSLERRLALLKAHQDHLPQLIERLKGKVSPSFRRNKEFFEQNQEQVIILSNGFRDFIVPIVADYGISASRVYANEFTFGEDGYINGFNQDNPLSESGGKVRVLEHLNHQGEIYVIGDGYNDYEIRKAGLAQKFYAFTENVRRNAVLSLADHEAPSLDEVLYVHNMNTALSYPKSRIKVLLLENIHAEAERLLKEEGYQVEIHAGGMDEEELCERIKNVQILGIRSKTQVTARVLENANRLIAIGAFCIGTNQIDLEACQQKGVAVFNAPYSNTRSVVELALAEMILLMRNLPDKVNAMHEGAWKKSASNSYEVRGKKLGIIGYGNIGKQLSVLAEGVGLDVYYFDLEEKLALGNATKCDSLEELLGLADIISLHIDGRPENDQVIGEKEFGMMKDGVIFMNLARGKVVEVPALKNAIESGKVRGAAVDVFPFEPKTNHDPFESELRGLPNTILTPHIGGSTLEAQINIANFVPAQIKSYINTGSTAQSVNFPQLQLPQQGASHRLLHIHHNTPGILAQINAVLSDHNANITGQYLKTNESIGYVIIDVDKEYDQAMIEGLKKIERTIWFRALY
ncbi:MAG TPA: phosphoglycerate dehydrogenase [Cytophagales bacterium]|nr:phosphoglycerate dehydrogenase [Cytophagales bacterium]HAA17897.1 phosphoglycerate dehydrogenase [Cytophagales bacterium]HAP58180.1 phosphoglycerate dehydrogenase [Cytophagales bacterium]